MATTSTTKTRKNGADSVKAKAEETVAQTKEALEEVTAQAGEELRNATDQGAKFVRDNPGLALAGAVGVGLLLGLSLRNRA